MPGTFGYPARSMLRTDLCEVIQARMSEMMEIVKIEIDKTDYADRIGAGIVMTGGASLMPGTLELANSIFHVPVRLGIPTDIPGLRENYQTPIYSTGVGLVLYGTDNKDDQGYSRCGEDHIFVKIAQEMHRMIKKYF